MNTSQDSDRIYKLISEIKAICSDNPTLSQKANEGIKKIIHNLNMLYQNNLNQRPDQLQNNFISTSIPPPGNLGKFNNINPKDFSLTENMPLSYSEFKNYINNSMPQNDASMVQFINNLNQMCTVNPSVLEHMKQYIEEEGAANGNQLIQFFQDNLMNVNNIPNPPNFDDPGRKPNNETI
ncbi:hypothetical protein TRFO_24165 [Tritrichomonas foetus]|uniref:Uncharacterized protein n=1 Tax=Tritrichomonas foetus TaxID=1144522 RepID=A0A1J4K9I1_9EUKA|nr:hypothetical protein TRFO_24165 [Tritrichomonas foetus]|eukprot:OHT07602.1 hypothetical protein TRFO_24165 [Tritrichomonas foetus]